MVECGAVGVPVTWALKEQKERQRRRELERSLTPNRHKQKEPGFEAGEGEIQG